jgi:deoxyribodipyrimidine photo-lyase
MNVFIFRRDLRVEDNTAFIQLMKDIGKQEQILPIFIFNTQQISPKINSFYSSNCVEFMIQCLQSLKNQINIQYFETSNDIDVLSSIERRLGIKRLYFNIDFTPYAIRRDETIIKWCKEKNIVCKTFEDYTLLPINHVTTNNKTFYSVFTPFYNKFLSFYTNIPDTQSISHTTIHKNVYDDKYIGNVKPNDIHKYYSSPNADLFVKGGRENGMVLLERVKNKELSAYDINRDYPSLDGTTRLSAYLKFGCISVREVYEAVKHTHGLKHGLIRELIWRDFYANITFNKPRVLNGQLDKRKGNLSFKENYDVIKWVNNKHLFKKWCAGETGVPIVDAAMRQLNTTGWMHNRCRMIVACFLVKDLLIDWRQGEQYFSTKLIDYDPSSNNGGWQFCSSTGVDAQPYFRIFNPFTQSQKFDSETKYIKKWVPELQDVVTKDIHSWHIANKKYSDTCKYPPPIVEHSQQIKKTLEMYKSALKS